MRRITQIEHGQTLLARATRTTTVAMAVVLGGCHGRTSGDAAVDGAAQAGDLPAAQRLAEPATGKNDGDFASLVAQGDAFLLQGDAAAAIRYFDQAIQAEPQRSDGYAKRAAALANLGNIEAAVADYDQAIARDASDPQVYLDRARVQLIRKRSDLALADCNKALRLDPKLAMAYLYRANIHIARGEFDAAIQACDTLLIDSPKLASAYNNRGVAYRSKGDLARALADYNKAIEFDTSFADAHNNRGEIYLRQGDNEKAMADFTAALRIDPAKIESYDHRGDLYLLLGLAEPAIADYSQIIDRALQAAAKNKTLRPGPKLAQVYLKRAAARLKAGQPSETIADVDAAVQLNPDDARAYAIRSEAYTKLGRTDLAQADAALARRMERFQRQRPP
jgi:tetratricopeptide (TPR) repeat protein